jgi:vancomycin permeability regulator SanA
VPLLVVAAIAVVVLLGALAVATRVQARGARHVVAVEHARPADWAVVLGAGLLPDGTPSPVLEDRVVTAVTLHRRGVVRRLLMSGSRRDSHDEPGAMRRLAVLLGVPGTDVQEDGGGHDTFQSAQGVARLGIASALAVTQAYHLPRTLYLLHGCGVPAQGVAADRRTYRRARWYRARELPACLKAAWCVLRTPRSPPRVDQV